MTDIDSSASPADAFATGNVPVISNLADPSVSLSALLTGATDFESLHSPDRPLSPAHLGPAAGLFRVLRLKHPTTANHSIRVALGCSAFAKHLDLDDETREHLELAALLHDIGKLALPDQVLNKPARLNDAELALMDRHLQLAAHVIEPFCGNAKILNAIAYGGHWYDGTRPTNSQIQGEELPVASRILAIQNAFDSMTSDFVYRAAFSVEQAIDELEKNAGQQFDPKLTAAFVDFYQAPDVSQTSRLVRSWVEKSNEQADSLWTLAAPILQVTSHTLSIFQQRLLQSMHDGVVFFDEDGKVVVWNEAANSLTGLSKESVHHKQWYPHVIEMRDMLGNVTELDTCPVRNCLEHKVETTQRMMVTNRTTGEQIAVNVHLMPVGDTTGAYHGAIMILHDVTSEYSLETHVQTLHNQATRDALTGVHNRAEFDRRHAELVSKHLNTGTSLGLVICDIDRFKSINDTYGHQAGDEALASFARLIESHCRGDDTVARYGGEEFVIICPGCDLKAATSKAENIRKNLASERQPALKQTIMTASFGVSELRGQNDDPSEMLKRADAALYEAKKMGRNRVIQEPGKADNAEKTTWTSWLRIGGRKQTNKLAQGKLRCSVPSELVLETIQGFVREHHAEVLSGFDGHKLELGMNDWASAQRRQQDRPMVLTIRIGLSDDDELAFGTIVDVNVFYHGSRERRMDDVVERAQLLLKELRRYLAAEDV